MHLIHSLKSRKDREDGFTLIELMVVVLIIAILIAIAIPTFLGMRQRAQDSAAKSDLRNALVAAKAHYTDAETYVGALAALPTIEPSLQYGAAASTTVVGVTVVSANEICLQKESKSGTDFFVRDNLATGTVGPQSGTC